MNEEWGMRMNIIACTSFRGKVVWFHLVSFLLSWSCVNVCKYVKSCLSPYSHVHDREGNFILPQVGIIVGFSCRRSCLKMWNIYRWLCVKVSSVNFAPFTIKFRSCLCKVDFAPFTVKCKVLSRSCLHPVQVLVMSCLGPVYILSICTPGPV